MLDQILTNPAIRYGAGIVAGILLVAIGWGAAIIWSVESRYRAQRKADRIAEQMRAGRELRALERVRMEAEYVKDAFQQMGEFSQMEGIMRALHELDSLRANQGGDAT